ncbi:SIS domain-containing protein [Bacillus sp. FJAT-27251]|uniref:SIS domain-containing protein n=1 Tax=Bacillus sp. FJAT-27251 TaxID=1684142 RepID=UPI0006A7C04D|nr:SIS domain-containing protein [Bacillus sp. FJAT-27251]
MWNHIYEQSDRLKDLFASSQVEEFVKAYDTRALRRIIFVASGSSLNITLVAKRFYQELAQVEITALTPFDFMNNSMIKGIDRETALIVAISQTGTSRGTVGSITYAKELGFKVLSLSEQRDTPVQQLGDYYLNFLSGPEPCNAKTKGVSNSLTLLMLLACWIGKEKEVLSAEDCQTYLDEVAASIDDVPATIEGARRWIESHKDWSTIQHFYVMGYGTNYGTAVEGMLKIMETLCVPASVCELGEFSHGFHRTITHNSNLITILTEEPGRDEMLKTNEFLREKAGRLLVVNATSDVLDDSYAISVPYRPLTASCLNINVVLQVLAAALPEIIGFDPNRPMNEELTRILGTRV